MEEENARAFIGGEVNAIPDGLARGVGDVFLRSPGGHGVSLKGSDLADELSIMACSSVLVASGTVGPSTVHMNSTRSYTYTAQSLSLREVFRDNSKVGGGPRAGLSTITVLSRGGNLDVGGRVVHAPTDFDSLVEGRDYLLFLTRYISVTGAYVADEPGFLLSNGLVTGLDHVRQRQTVEVKSQALVLSALRQVVGSLSGRKGCLGGVTLP
jgi:hypothetical protein